MNSEEPPENPVQEQPKSSGGWGSLWSSVTSYVDVGSIASSAQSLGKMTVQSLDKVYEILEPPQIESDEETTNPEEEEGSNETSEPKEKKKGKGKENQSEEGQETETQESKDNSEGDAQTILYSTLSSVWNWAGEVKNNVENNDLIHQGFGIGETIINQSLSTLETVGKKTINIVLQENQHHEEKSEKITPEATDSKSVGPVTFTKGFDLSAGNAHLNALELLASECALKIKSQNNLLTSNESQIPLKKQIDKELKTMATFFNVENISDEIENSKEFILTTDEGFSQFQNLLNNVDIELYVILKNLQANLLASEKNISEIIANFNKEFELLKEEKELNQPKVEELASNTFKLIQNKGVQVLSKFSSKSIEQLLRIGEHFVLAIADSKQNQNQRISKLNHLSISKVLRELTIILLKDSYCIVSIHVQAIEEIGNAIGTILTSQNIETQQSSIVNEFYVDAGDAIAFIQDGFQSLHPITKLIVYENSLRSDNEDKKEEEQGVAVEKEEKKEEKKETEPEQIEEKAKEDVKENEQKEEKEEQKDLE